MNYEVLVNKQNPLGISYTPNSLMCVNNRYKKNMVLETRTYLNFKRLQKHALKLGYIIDISSAYRSYEYQERIVKKLIKEKGMEYAANVIAKPGTSEHQTGLAIDICVYKNNICLTEYETKDLEETSWIHNIMHNYGFILRYKEGKEKITGYNYEPWHVRYVGKKLANYLYKNNLTLEEYHIKKEEHI